MVYKITLYGVVDYDYAGFGKPIWGQVVLRENIPKITTARILACRYSKQYRGFKYGTDITLWDGGKAIEKICWYPDGCRMEKDTYVPSTPSGRSPIMHYYYDVNARDGKVTLRESYQKKW